MFELPSDCVLTMAVMWYGYVGLHNVDRLTAKT